MDHLFVPLALVAGALLTVQAGANAQLSKAVGSAFAATTLQLCVGAALLLLIAAATGGLLSLHALPNIPWWHLLGGTASAFYVVSAILLFPRLGAIVSVGLFIAGQILTSFALDMFGLLGVTAQPVTLAVSLGAAAVLTGTVLIVFGQQDATKELSASRLGWIALALLAGAVLPVQGAVNALLRADLGAPMAVGAVSFVVATLAMAVVLIIAVAFLHAPKPYPSGVSAMPWWGWLGGFAGAIYVTTIFTAIPAIGAAAAFGLTVAGQQIASVFVDRYGWLKLPRRPVSFVRLTGVALLLAGVALIKAG